jgi:catechol 2,3-dioxygenase-like lactoylglutathione lyase family enzyme
MARVIFGNHAAVVVPRNERDRIRRFYCDILGFRVTRGGDDKDDFQLGDRDYFHLSILYGDVPDESAFLRSARSVFLELKSDDVDHNAAEDPRLWRHGTR